MPSIRNPSVQPVAIRWNSHDTLPVVDGMGHAVPLLTDSNTGRLLVDVPPAANPSTANGLLTSIDASLQSPLQVKVPGFNLPPYDYLACSYTGSNLTGVVYKTGGSGGTTVATLALGYDGSGNLSSVTKS